MKVLLIHPPFHDQKGLIAGGLFAIADYLNRSGHPTQIIHLGIEEELDSSFSIRDYVLKQKIGLVGISMHWCEQIPAAIKTAQALNGLRCSVVLGGHAAGHFADDILAKFDCVDFVIRGEGEKPLLDLCNELDKPGQQLDRIPNLLYRDRGKTVKNKIFYTAGRKQLDSLNFSNLKLLKNYRSYMDLSTPPPFSIRDPLPLMKPCFFLLQGRGCRYNCTFCGGSRRSFVRLYNRPEVTLRSPEKILESILEAYETGYRYIFMGFDPQPKNSYYQYIFSRIRKMRLELGMIFELPGLPEINFLEELSATFSPAGVIISPESASERVRKANKSIFFSNSEMEDTLVNIGRLGLFCHLYYSYFLCHDRQVDIRRTLITIGSYAKKYGHFLFPCYNPLLNDPCAAYRLDPEAYNMSKVDDSLENYLTLRPGNDGTISHPTDMPCADAIRLSHLITLFLELILRRPNFFQYIDKKAGSTEYLLGLIETWISSHPDSVKDSQRLFLWLAQELGIEDSTLLLLNRIDLVEQEIKPSP